MGHSEKHQHHEYPRQGLLVVAFFVAILGWLTYGNNPTVLDIAKNQFDLTSADLRMIPLSALMFTVFWLIMQKVFFNPLLSLVEEREAKTSGAKSSAEDLLNKAMSAEKSYTEKLSNAQVEGARQKLDTLTNARKTASSINEQAQKEILEKLSKGRLANQKEAAELKEQLLAKSDELVKEAVKKITDIPSSIVHGFLFLLTSSILVLTLSSDSFAAGDGHAPHISHLTWYFINFALYVALIVYLVKEPFKRFWAKRRELIFEALNKGEMELRSANEKLRVAEENLAKLSPDYLQEITRKIAREGEKEASEIVEQAKQSASNQQKQAESTLQAEKRSASLQVRNLVAEQVVKQVEEKVKATYSKDIDQNRRASALSGFKNLT